MEVGLLPDRAPVTVNNFVALADDGWYDDTIFHRIANSIDIIQAGDPSCTASAEACGSGGPGYEFDDELSGDEKYVTGTVAMANSGPNTNGSQFFVVTGPNASALPPSYTVFGELIGKDSLEVAQQIQSLPLQVRQGAPAGSEADQPKDQIWIRGVKIQEG
jgi:cyclophilin family peptidyl-prolyl cis-trans isomerase